MKGKTFSARSAAAAAEIYKHSFDLLLSPLLLFSGDFEMSRGREIFVFGRRFHFSSLFVSLRREAIFIVVIISLCEFSIALASSRRWNDKFSLDWFLLSFYLFGSSHISAIPSLLSRQLRSSFPFGRCCCSRIISFSFSLASCSDIYSFLSFASNWIVNRLLSIIVSTVKQIFHIYTTRNGYWKKNDEEEEEEEKRFIELFDGN